MKRLLVRWSTATIVLLGAVGVSGQPAAAASPWKLTVAPPGVPTVKAGASCSSTNYELAQTQYHTTVVCKPYITFTGAVARHYSYVKFNPLTNDFCSSDGYFFKGGSLPGVYQPSVCNVPTSGRIPWPFTDRMPPGR